MALVFKINYQSTLRRWVASVDEASFSLTLEQVEAKIRDLFGLSPTAVLIITYVDSENDIITLGDDKDLRDACLVQRLNPLRLEVRVQEGAVSGGTTPSTAQPFKDTPESSSRRQQQAPPSVVPDNMDVESFLKTILPQATLDNIKQLTSTFAPGLNLKFPLPAPSSAQPTKDTPEFSSGKKQQTPPPIFSENMDIESFLKTLLPQVSLDYIKQLINTFAPGVNLKLPLAALPQMMEEVFKRLSLCPDGSGTGQHASSGARAGGSTEAGNADEQHYSNNPGPQPRQSVGTDSPSNDQQEAVHRGVQCDRCGAQPIKGARYTSTKVYNYDLCSKCFEAHGKENDFQKLEYPGHVPRHGFHSRPWERHLQKPEHPVHPAPRGFHSRPWPTPSEVMGRGFGRLPFTRGPYGWRPEFKMNAACPPADGPDDRKLDARFIKDVSIFDGTELAPGTKFTKIWRLRNSGTLPWPQNTQLMHIGGDALGTEAVTSLELPEAGLPCDQETDVYVDLVAPGKPGRYVSYWRLVSPIGHKFGYRLWAQIQVVPQGEESPQLQASLKEEETDKREVHAGDGSQMEAKSSGIMLDASVPKDGSINTQETISEALVDKPQHAKRDIQIDGEEVDGFSVVEKPVESAAQDEQGGKNNQPKDASQETNNEELQALESMGFINQDLNLLLLAKNNGNLQQTLDDLLVSAGWDRQLNDIQEMGFLDQPTNIRLLVKNNGSLKRVVKELVDMEKNSRKGKAAIAE